MITTPLSAQTGAPPDDAGAEADRSLPAAHPGSSGAAGAARRRARVLDMLHQPRWANPWFLSLCSVGFHVRCGLAASPSTDCLGATIKATIKASAHWTHLCIPILSALPLPDNLTLPNHAGETRPTCAGCCTREFSALFPYSNSTCPAPFSQARTRPTCAGCWTLTPTCSWCSSRRGWGSRA